MQYAFANEDYKYSFDFKVNGDFAYPDEGAYSYKIRTMDGTVLMADEGCLEVSPQDTQDGPDVKPVDSAFIEIPAEFNTIEGALFDARIVEISFTYKGKPIIMHDSYRIVEFYYFSATPKDVRDYYGLNIGELPDEDIDLVDIYLQLVQKFDQEFISALQSAGQANFRANRLIVLKGVVQVFPSVRLRVNQEENDGSSKFLRYLNKINWDDLLNRALAEIEDLENNLSGEEVVTLAGYNPFYLGAVTDAITGEES